MKKFNSKGFSAVEALFVLLVIGLVSGIGWYVYGNQSGDPVSSEPTAATEQDETQGDNKSYYEIKELGVKFDLSKAPDGLYYFLGNDGKTAYFSLEDLKNTDCAADKTAQVALTRYNDEDFTLDQAAIPQKDEAKKMNGFYYFTLGGQAMCSEDVAVQEKASNLRAEISQLLPDALVMIEQ
jgi:hypothetical protein